MLTSTLGRFILATVKNILKVLFIFVFNLFSASSHALILSSFFGNPNKITTQSSFEYIWQLSTRWEVFIVVSNPRYSSNMHVNISLDWPFFSTKFFNSDSNFFQKKADFHFFSQMVTMQIWGRLLNGWEFLQYLRAFLFLYFKL